MVLLTAGRPNRTRTRHHAGRQRPLPHAQRPGLLFLVLTVTFASVDWIMSLDPEWFSTIFGLLTIAGWGSRRSR